MISRIGAIHEALRQPRQGEPHSHPVARQRETLSVMEEETTAVSVRGMAGRSRKTRMSWHLVDFRSFLIKFYIQVFWKKMVPLGFWLAVGGLLPFFNL